MCGIHRRTFRSCCWRMAWIGCHTSSDGMRTRAVVWVLAFTVLTCRWRSQAGLCRGCGRRPLARPESAGRVVTSAIAAMLLKSAHCQVVLATSCWTTCSAIRLKSSGRHGRALNQHCTHNEESRGVGRCSAGGRRTGGRYIHWWYRPASAHFRRPSVGSNHTPMNTPASRRCRPLS